MTSSNLELAESIYAAWERGDYGEVGWADPEIEFVIADGPSPGVWTGLDGMAQGWRDWLSLWHEFRQWAEGFRELDDGRVLVLFGASGRGKISGVEIAEIGRGGAGIFDFRDGKVVRFMAYLDRQNAPAV